MLTVALGKHGGGGYKVALYREEKVMDEEISNSSIFVCLCEVHVRIFVSVCVVPWRKHRGGGDKVTVYKQGKMMEVEICR